MWKIVVGLIIGFSPTVCQAAGLRELIIGASPDAQIYVYGVIAIFAVGIVGMAGSMILSAFGNGKIARLVTNGSYLAAVGIFLTLAVMLFKQFVVMVAG